MKRRQRELRREHVAAVRERKAKEAKVQELRNRAIDVQVRSTRTARADKPHAQFPLLLRVQDSSCCSGVTNAHLMACGLQQCEIGILTKRE